MPSSPSFIKRPPSLRDLAQELGVSHTTVALALKNDTRISFDVRKRVQAKANERGYFLNDIPKNLFGGRSSLVGLVVPDLEDPFYARMVEGIQEQLWNAEKNLLIFSAHGDLDREEKILERYARLRVDGVILVPSQSTGNRAHFAEILRKSTPLVTVERSLKTLDLPQVRTDEMMGIVRATVFLMDAGCRYVAFSSSNLDKLEAVELRRRGYEQVMHRGGFPSLTAHLNLLRNAHGEALAELERLLHLPSGERVDAIVAASDDTAVRLIGLLQEMGFRVPEDISVTGFGNRGERRNVFYNGPPLTTVDLCPEKLGEEAALMVLNLRDSRDMAKNDILVEPLLIHGRTTRPQAQTH